MEVIHSEWKIYDKYIMGKFGNLRWTTYKEQANNKISAFQRKIEALEARIAYLEDKINGKKRIIGSK